MSHWTWLVLVGLLGCTGGGWVPTSQYSGTSITPGHFRFATITEAGDGPHAGGWRAVCIRAKVSQGVMQGGKQHTVSSLECDVEVGVPIKLHSGRWIPLREAQRAAASAANRAAHMTVTTSNGITAQTCELIRRRMELFLHKQEILGARVTECGVNGPNVPEVPFP